MRMCAPGSGGTVQGMPDPAQPIAGRVGISIVLGITVAVTLVALGGVTDGIPVPVAGLPALLLVVRGIGTAFPVKHLNDATLTLNPNASDRGSNGSTSS